MKEVFKMERLRLKMRPTVRPKKHGFVAFTQGQPHSVTEAGVKNLIEIVDREHKSAIAWLNKELEKLTK